MRFNALSAENKVQLLLTLNTLLKTTGLPQEIEKSLTYLTFDLDALSDDMLNESDISSLVSTSKRMYTLFQPTRLLDKFLERVAYGEQDKVERLFTVVYQGNAEKIQIALCCQRRFTDYSGREFNCTAYEYAYWAKDTHMCRMLERYMDDATKATMLARINEIERIDATTQQPVRLKYQQNGAEHRSAHFDLTPLITALQEYVNGCDAWVAAENRDAIKAAWMKVGMAQRDVPAHVAQEYCHPTRSFDPLLSFNVDRDDIPRETLPRVLAFYNWNNGRNESWFPLGLAESGLGFDFALMRWLRDEVALGESIGVPPEWLRLDLAAITRLDEVRTADLTLSRDHLNPQARPCMAM